MRQVPLLRSISSFFRFLFWPNPGHADYGDPAMITLLSICGALIILSFVIKYWRSKQANPVTRRLSKSWSRASFWLGIVGLVLVVSRVEEIQFFAMRLLWVLWFAFLALYLFFQVRQFRMRHYEVMPKVMVSDPRDKYLPKKKGGK